MKDAELRQYAGQWVEARLVDGSVLIGRLLVDEPSFLLRSPFEIEQPAANPDAAPPRISIEALIVESVRVIGGPPETSD